VHREERELPDVDLDEVWRAEAEHVLRGHPDVWLLSQPRNLGTTPALLRAILSVSRVDPDANVLITPSDHHFDDESAFVRAALAATGLSSSDGAHLHLLGIHPDEPVEGCGWIVPGPAGGVAAFREKPPPDEIAGLIGAGALVNCFVIAGRGAAFADLLRHAVARPVWLVPTAVPAEPAVPCVTGEREPAAWAWGPTRAGPEVSVVVGEAPTPARGRPDAPAPRRAKRPDPCSSPS
jgi:hypothetical protein